MSIQIRLCSFFVYTVFLVNCLSAQVPQLINYQGRVAIGTPALNFDGSGSFKFALVDAGGTATYWSNDGTSSNGSEPTAAVTLAVSKGLYSVLLGDATLPNMTVLPSTVFQNSQVYLRVWFNDGVNGSQQLSPDQRIAAVGYAMVASEALTVPDGAITSAKLADGAVGSTQLSNGAVQANLEASGQSGVPSGGVVLSAAKNNYALQSAGYIRIGTAVTVDGWEERINGMPSARGNHTSIWTGSEMIVWGGATAFGQGGNQSVNLNDGGRYNPATNSWTAIATSGAPSARQDHTSVWTGSEMIVWGGAGNSGTSFFLNDGARYDPVTDSWTATAASGVPSGRRLHTSVWTGSEMIVWGGVGLGGDDLNDGGRYNPATDSWTATAISGAPSARERHTSVWTGSEMIVWGGFDRPSFGLLNDGARYNPATNNWTATATSDSPSVRYYHTSVWTGSEMIVWGGAGDSILLNDGARYDPVNDSWTATDTSNAPSGRSNHTSVWTGSEMIVWGGGLDSSGLVNDGGRYDPVTDSWTSTTTIADAAPSGRRLHTSVWTGSEMIVWGGSEGFGFVGYLNDGARYNPTADNWTASTTSDATPPARRGHTSVWTGSEMIVWGGLGSGLLNYGARYDPVTNSWKATAISTAPSARELHTSVWTGSEMVVWGGLGSGDINLNDGARYNPVTDSWKATATSDSPSARYYHTSVWTGSEMIVWGGVGSSRPLLNDGASYDPVTDSWTATATSDATPPARRSHTSVWTGSEMIVWGGFGISGSSSNFLNDGARYDPIGDNWTATAISDDTPSARNSHTSVWTGSEMIVWGGFGGGRLNDGARYDLVTDSWTATATFGAPSARNSHTSVWTSSEMIVWGGFDGSRLNDGARYDPVNDSWTATAISGAPSVPQDHTSVWTGREMIVWGGSGSSGLNEPFSYTPPKLMYLYQRP